ncbi:putative T7SS-secreted protein [Kibdelosporangium phytohabitans]|uniref:Putative T7SS secretion signal domain-containing protein n=1 Tax=Kibdelosporangium phytohabitans TaxID=860235 RepID=A0A0N9I1U7_9PSEU|nr:hypothetical protein [Kibdelosporangium phytohabitans]ALG12526.1 hypothetical protein AOZ06_41740 [Kibdelosporangium phytohabitans]MBE1464129.1 hypothetical protein [Kibdelosporangium phytohabitans]
MAAELGQTLDPRALIPGMPEAISSDLQALVDTVKQVGSVGQDLGSVDVVEWTGQAANSFLEMFGQEPPKWMQAVEDMGLGGQALADFGDTLTWAQGEAQRAIEMYTEAMAASRAAAADALNAAQNGVVTPFTDPAAAAFHNAQTVLQNAREQLASAGGSIAEMFGMQDNGEGKYTKQVGNERGFGVDGHNPNKPGWHKGPGGKSYNREFGSQNQGGLGDVFGGLMSGALKQLGIDIPEGEWKAAAEAKVWGAEAEGKFDNGTFNGSGKAGIDVLGAGAEAHAKWGPDGLTAGASAEAYLAKASAEGTVGWGDHASVSGKAEGFVGANAEAEANIGWGGADVSAGAFAGAKAEGDIGAEVGGVGAGVHGEAWAGAGAEASAQLGMGNDGKFHIGASVGLGLGVGAKLGFDVSVDPGKVVDTVSDVAGAVGDGISSAGKAIDDGIGNAAKGVKNFFGL